MEEVISEGDDVLLYLSGDKRWLVKVKVDKKVHTHAGYIEGSNIIGKRYGEAVKSNLGRNFWLLKPTVEDYVLKCERKTQVVYPKDMGLIAAKTGLTSGSIVVEAGTGSGALTMFLANIVKPTGHVYSMELKEEFLDVARRNLKRSGLLDYVTLSLGDASQGFGVIDADVAVIDVGDPWRLVESAWRALKGAGKIVSISPTMNQVEKTHEALLRTGFVDVECIEVLVRSMQVKSGATRPSTRMIGHTAYLTFARKVFGDEKTLKEGDTESIGVVSDEEG
ncbi:MAG: tRNA (adenine-N1)-methyltransferase [Nitrososphaerales archaeon]